MPSDGGPSGLPRTGGEKPAVDHAVGLKSMAPRSLASNPSGVRRIARSPQTRERLGRLRAELGKISPPENAEEARAEIIQALSRAGLGEWTLPELGDPQCERFANGSIAITLLAHTLWLSANGAFRIADLHPPQMTYFEARGRRGQGFVLPSEAGARK